MALLKPLALQKALDQANTGGVYASMLLNQAGSPIAQAILAGERQSASIACHIWKLLLTTGDSIRGGNLDTMIIDCENGKVVVGGAAHYILVIYAKNNVETGLLTAKFDTIRSHILPALLSIADA